MKNKEVSFANQCYITRRALRSAKINTYIGKNERTKKISKILNKNEPLRTTEDIYLLEKYSDLVKQIKLRKERFQIYKERVTEREEPMIVIEKKVNELAKIILQAKHLICYTGAGISTSAHIPDYRGSSGIWTLLRKGEDIKNHDLSLANPTYTHMALFELHRKKLLKHIVSQNCDGLHLRSGVPVHSLSEIHGNMYVEVCTRCKPNSIYWRLFDTTELTARYAHKTNRRCYKCEGPLMDSIVHFGEKGTLNWPLNWVGACNNADNADVILCVGSSLKVLKKYSWLWQMNRASKNRAKVCVVNLQWTPKDNISTLKINGKCDIVFKLLMKCLNIDVPQYSKARDPIFSHATTLLPEEVHTVSQPLLKKETEVIDDSGIFFSKIEAHQSIVNTNNILSASSKILRHSILINTPCSFNNDIIHCTNNISDISFGSESDNHKIQLDRNFFSPILNSDHIKQRKTEDSTFWFDVSYAYPGLHSIACPPPRDINMWNCEVVSVLQMNRFAATCDFCFDNYAELECQFYKKLPSEFLLKNRLNPNSNFCECCDNGRIEVSGLRLTKRREKAQPNVQAGWYGKGCKINRKKHRKR